MIASLSRRRETVLARLVRNAPQGKLGRTALMKLAYFLQEIEGVSLGYDFRLHAYGPVAHEVLSDLATATALGILDESVALTERSYEYEIVAGGRGGARTAGSDDPDLCRSVDRILAAFGTLDSADLELLSLIVFADREFTNSESRWTSARLLDRVQGFRPNLTKAEISARLDFLMNRGWLKCEAETASANHPEK